MPKAQIPPGYAKVEGLGTYGPTTWANVFYVDCSPSDPTQPNDAMAAAAAAIAKFYNELAGGAFSVNWTLERIRVTYRADEDSIYTTTIADAQPGTASGDAQDAQVAYLINWVSGDARKGGKPRQYLCGVPNASMQDSARLTPTLLTNMNVKLAAFLAAFPFVVGTGEAVELVEMSFVNGKADRPTPIARPIVAGYCNPVVATQRRRIDRLRT